MVFMPELTSRQRREFDVVFHIGGRHNYSALLGELEECPLEGGEAWLIQVFDYLRATALSPQATSDMLAAAAEELA